MVCPKEVKKVMEDWWLDISDYSICVRVCACVYVYVKEREYVHVHQRGNVPSCISVSVNCEIKLGRALGRS